MLTLEQRRRAIVDQVNQSGPLSVELLAEQFGVSIQTLRSDIRGLTEQGLLLRRHGQVAPFPSRENISFEQREILNIEGKQRIGQAVAAQLEDYQVVFLGTGTTVEQVARGLMEHRGLHVLTNNLHALRYLCLHPDCELTIAGGRVRKRDQDVIGGEALRFFQRYRADVGVVSVGGIGADGALYDYNDDEVLAREALLASCRIRILAVDSTKLGKEATCQVGHITDFDLVICDQPAPGVLQQVIAADRWLVAGTD